MTTDDIAEISLSVLDIFFLTVFTEAGLKNFETEISSYKEVIRKEFSNMNGSEDCMKFYELLNKLKENLK